MARNLCILSSARDDVAPPSAGCETASESAATQGQLRLCMSSGHVSTVATAGQIVITHPHSVVESGCSWSPRLVEIKYRSGALAELRRLLRPGGRLVVGETRLDPYARSPDQLRQ